MKCVIVERFGGPEVLQIKESPVTTPGPGAIRIRVHAVGVNPVECYVRSGNYARLPALPYTPGTDCAGIVDAVGPESSRFQVGDRVYTHGSISGTYAEFTMALETQVKPLPDNTSFEHGAALGIPYATAHRALFGRGNATRSEVALVHGASGGVGLAAVQLARAAGCTVVATAGTPAGLQLCLNTGAHAAFNHHSPDHFTELLSATRNRGFDVIVEMLANVNLGTDLQLLAPRGRVVVVGSRGPVEINPRETMLRDADIRGLILANATGEELSAIHRDLREGLAAGTLLPVIGHRFPLESAADAHQAVMADGKLGKIILTVRD